MRSEIAGLTIGFVKSDSATRRYASTAAVHADERRPGETSLRTSVERAVGRSLESNVTTGSFVGFRRPAARNVVLTRFTRLLDARSSSWRQVLPSPTHHRVPLFQRPT